LREWPAPKNAEGAGVGAMLGARSTAGKGGGEGSYPSAANTLEPPAANSDKSISEYMPPILEGQSCTQIQLQMLLRVDFPSLPDLTNSSSTTLHAPCE